MREGFHEADDEHVVSAYPWHVATTPRRVSVPPISLPRPSLQLPPPELLSPTMLPPVVLETARLTTEITPRNNSVTSSARPYGSVRLEAIHLADHGNETSLEVDQDYAQARDHGVEQGYHLFTDSQVPEAPATPRSEWKVDVANLASTNDNTDLLKDGQLSKRELHERAMLRHEPDRELPTHADALRTTATELSAVDLKLPPMTERLGGLLATFPPVLDAYVRAAEKESALDAELAEMHPVAREAVEGRNQVTTQCLALRSELLERIAADEASCAAALQLAEEQAAMRERRAECVRQWDEAWGQLDREGKHVRREALEKMRRLMDALLERLTQVRRSLCRPRRPRPAPHCAPRRSPRAPLPRRRWSSV